MRRSLRFNAHVTCSLLQRVLHTHCIQQTEYSYCYTLWWDDLYCLIHMSHARYYNACWGLTHTLYSANGIQLLLHTVMRRSLQFNAHVTCWLLQRVLGTRAHTVFSKRIQCYCYTLCWDELYRSMHMSHADYYHDSHIHCVQFSKRNAVIVTQSVGTSFTVQCTSHAHYYKACWGHTCTHCIQQTDTMLLLHTVMGQSLRFNAHITCSLLQIQCVLGTQHIHCVL